MLSSLIYTASVLHAAVNFPQKPLQAFVPNTPGSVYAKPPTDKVRRIELDVSKIAMCRNIICRIQVF